MTQGIIRVALLLSLCASVGCASTTQNGALVGAGTGAVLGAGTGLLVSEPSLLGSEASQRKGNTSLAVGPTMLAGALIGAVFGATVGAMVGHSNERPADDSALPGASADAQVTPRAF